MKLGPGVSDQQSVRFEFQSRHLCPRARYFTLIACPSVGTLSRRSSELGIVMHVTKNIYRGRRVGVNPSDSGVHSTGLQVSSSSL